MVFKYGTSWLLVQLFILHFIILFKINKWRRSFRVFHSYRIEMAGLVMIVFAVCQTMVSSDIIVIISVGTKKNHGWIEVRNGK